MTYITPINVKNLLSFAASLNLQIESDEFGYLIFSQCDGERGLIITHNTIKAYRIDKKGFYSTQCDNPMLFLKNLADI